MRRLVAGRGRGRGGSRAAPAGAPRRRRPSVLGRAPLRPDGGLVARGARRRGLGDRLPQRRLLRAAGRRARRRRPAARATGSSPRAGTGSAGACGPTTRSPSTARSGPHRFLRSPRLDAHARAAARGRRAAAGRLVRATRGGTRSAAAGASRSPIAGGARRVRPRGPAARRGARPALRRRRAGGAAALVDVSGRSRSRPPTRRSRRSSDTSRWPDFGCAGGRFTALRSGGLEGQTFEIEVVAHPAPRTPVFTRGYVTATGSAHGAGRDPRRPRARGAGRARAPGGRDAAAPARAHHPRGPLPRPRRLPARRLGGGRRRVHPRRRRVGSAPAAPGRPVPARGPGGAGGVLGRRADRRQSMLHQLAARGRRNVNPGWAGARV